MFRASTKLSIGAYSQFILDNKGLHTGLTFLGRSRKLASLYRSLDSKAKQSLIARASKKPAFKRHPVKTVKEHRPVVRKSNVKNPYITFVKAKMRTVEGATQVEKVRKIAKLWRAQRK
jgi:hypothetical protein